MSELIRISLGRLPYLIVFIVGIAIAYNSRRKNPQLALWALACYGTLTVLWVMEALQIGWVISAHQNGMRLSEIEPLLNGVQYLRMGIRYAVMAALVAGVFRWRDEIEYPSGKLRILVAVSILSVVIGMIIGRVLVPERFMIFLLYFCELGSDIALMIAFFGWRVKSHHPVSNTGTDKETSAVGTPDAVQNAQPAEESFATFAEEDYFPFVFGVMVLGGLVVVPVMWGMISGFGFGKSVFPSVLSCGVFVFAHDRRGNFSLLKFIGGIIFMFLIIMRTLAQSGGNPKSMFFAGGILGYIVMLSCGWVGIRLGRLFRH